MVKPASQENPDTEKSLLFTVPQRRGMPRHEGPHGEVPGQPRGREHHRKWAQEPLLLFLQEGTGKTGLANVNNFSGV